MNPSIPEITSTPIWKRPALIVPLALLVIVLLLAGAGYRSLYRPVRLAAPETVDIHAHTSLGFVANRLRRRGLIPNALAFRLYARATGQSNKLKAGEYEITDGQRPVDMLALFVSGHAKAYWLTIPEGKWVSELPAYLQAQWPEAAADFPGKADEIEHWQSKVPFRLNRNSLEGYLFPDTYRFVKNVSAEQVITAMLKRFTDTCWTAYRAHKPADGRSFDEVLILASLVEAEAKKDAERPIIAGVYLNRLHMSPPMKLDCNATLIYARGIRVTRVLNKDLLIPSPYNTYLNTGLPPGPICNPGLASFTAALHPKASPYYYYFAKGDGSHIFSRTLLEQSAVIKRIRGK